MKKIYLPALLWVAIACYAVKSNAQTGNWKLSGNTLAGGEKLGSLNNADVRLITNGTTRMTIKGITGNIGVGTPSPGAQLHLSFNSSQNNPQLLLEENAPNDYARISFKNTSNPNYFTIAGLPAVSSAAASLNFYYLGTGNIMSMEGDGKVSFTGKVGINRTIGTRDLTLGNSIQIGTIESLIDGGSDLLQCSASFIPINDNDGSTLGMSGDRWSAVWAADGMINTSDIRDKKNIRDLDYGLNKIMQLHPVKFNWKDGINTGDKVGIIAQEIQKVLPEVVRDYDIKTDEVTGKQEKVPSARLGVMYADIIPVLIKSIQELEMQVAELQKQVKNNAQTTTNISSENKAVVSKTTNSNAMLEQNAPNPFNNSTIICYRIPASAANAQIMITNAAGSTVKTFFLVNKGSGSVTINANELAAGNYYYVLLVDGKKVDTKQMILAK